MDEVARPDCGVTSFCEMYTIAAIPIISPEKI